MKLAVDCDEVLAGLLDKLIIFHNDRYGTSLLKKDFLSYTFRDTIGGTFEEEHKKFTEFLHSHYFASVQPIPNSAETLRNLKRNGFEMEIVTARPPEIINSTLEWVKLHYRGIFSNVHFARNPKLATNGKTKGEICLDIGADYMIEDGPEYALDVASKGINVLLYDNPWNRNNTFLDNVKRVSSWKDIEKIVLTSSRVRE